MIRRLLDQSKSARAREFARLGNWHPAEILILIIADGHFWRGALVINARETVEAPASTTYAASAHSTLSPC
jgi:hypothetical protein